MKKKIIFILILLLAAFFRFYNVNWDQNQHLHPDERFLTMVGNGISWPITMTEYFDTNLSPLNPHNRGFGFFVYGDFPVFFTKYVASVFSQDNYVDLTLIGRKLSAFVDLGTVVLVYFIAKQLKSKPKHSYFPLLAMFFYAVSVLSIQLSHFYAVDTYLTFFITLSFYFLIKLINYKFILNPYFLILNFLLGISFGLAISSKISAILFLPIIILGFFYKLFKERNILQFFILNFTFLILTYFTLRLAYPYLFLSSNLFNFLPNPKLIDNWKQLKSFDDPNSLFPPSIQWIKTKPIIYPLKNLIFWGLGLPLGVISLFAVFFQSIYLTKEVMKKKISIIHNSHFQILFFSLLWILIFFLYEGIQFAKNMRYFHPIYPFLAILSSWFVFQTIHYLKNKYKFKPFTVTLFHCLVIAFALIYPLSFISIYSHPQPRINASIWIYENIPPGSVLSSEYWDDSLPLSLNNFHPDIYRGFSLHLYDPDTPQKWQTLGDELNKIDYIILSSNRLYGSIMTIPERYPVTNHFYNSLFDGTLGFQKVAEFTSRPNLPIPFIKVCLTPPFARYGVVALKTQSCPLPGLNFVDDYSDESFTVYDHPKVIIFKKITSVNYLNLLLK